jgi:DNA-binding HxlR family transcriptional regulator
MARRRLRTNWYRLKTNKGTLHLWCVELPPVAQERTMNAEHLFDAADEVSEFLRHLAIPEHLLVLASLTTRERDAAQLRAETGLSPGILDSQLSRLRAEGVITSVPGADPVRYRITDPTVLDLMLTLRRNFCDEDDNA